MASEIRVNTINNSSGLGTITISDTGAFFSGITTISDLRITGTSNAGVTTVSAGSASVPSISPSGDTDTGIFFPAADTIGFAEGGSEAARIDSAGRLLVGTSTSRSVAIDQSTVQIEGISGADSAISLTRNVNANTGPYLYFGKSRGTSVGASTIVNNGDSLGRIRWAGADGTDINSIAGEINCQVDGTPGANDMPGSLVFSTTADGAATPTERMRIDSSGDIGIGANPGFSNGSGVKIARTGTACLRIEGDSASKAVEIYADSTGTTIDSRGTGAVTSFDIAGSTQMVLDNSGRLLVGTSSSSSNGGYSRYGLIQVQGNQNNSSGSGILTLRRGEAPGSITNNEDIGVISFASNDNNEFAWIRGHADGATGTNDYPGRLTFSTTADGASSPTERMRLTSTGRLNIARTSDGTSAAYVNIQVTSSFAGICFDADSTSTRTATRFNNGNGNVGNILISGSSTIYSTSSDYRLKENVVPVADGIARLQQLNPSRFNFIADPDTTVDGFIAHEVQTVVPEAVTGAKDATETVSAVLSADGSILARNVTEADWEAGKIPDEDSNTVYPTDSQWVAEHEAPVYQGIDQSKLVPLLTAALQEAIGKIEALETANASLEARLTALEGQ